MAIQFARMHIIGMGDGSTAVGSSAYVSGTKQIDETTGEVHDRRGVGRSPEGNQTAEGAASGRADGDTATGASEYITGTGQHAKPVKGAERVAHAEVLLPTGAPEAYRENSKLWNALQTYEFHRVEAAGNLAKHLRSKVQFAGHLILALPRDAAVSKADHIAMTREFAHRHFVSKGHAVEAALHYDNMGNPHAHLLISIRTMQKDGTWNPDKTRNFGGVTFRGVSGQGPRMADKNPWGAQWRDFQNEYFKAHGIEVNVDPTQVIPGVHLGPGAHIPDSRVVAENAERFGESYRLLTLNPELALQALTETQSTFTRADVAKYLSKNGFDGDDFQTAFARVMTNPEVNQLYAPVTLKAQDLYTTAEIRTYEERFVAAIDTLSARETHGVDLDRVRQLAAEQGLGPDQIAGAVHIASPGAFKQEQGRAGTGKTTMVKTAIAAQKEAGYDVIGVAPTNAAAKELGKAADIQARSIDSLLYRLSLGQSATTALSDKTILYVDEAGLVDSRRLAKLVHLVEGAGAKIILLGDERQFPAINAGAPFAHTTSHYQTHALETIRRQEQAWDRDASSAAARGDFDTALSLHNDNGRVHIMKNAKEAKETLIADWLADRDRGSSQFIFAYSKYSATELAYMAREELQSIGAVGAGQHMQSDFAAETPMYGDRFVFDNGLAGEVAELRFDPDSNTSSVVLKMDGGQNVEFATEELGLARAYRSISVNDEVVMRETDHTLGVTGGMIGRVTSLDGGKMAVDFGTAAAPDVRTIDTAEYAAWDRGYAGTLLRGQGATIDRGYLYHTPTWDRAASYVGMTRHRKHMGIYANGRVTKSLDEMAEQMAKQRAKHFSMPHLTYTEAQARKGVYDQVSQEIREAAKLVGPKELETAKAFADFLEKTTARDRARFQVHFTTSIAIDPAKIADPVKRAQAEYREARRTARYAKRAADRGAAWSTRTQDRVQRTTGAARRRVRVTLTNSIKGFARWADRTANITGGLGTYVRRTKTAFSRPGLSITTAVARQFVPREAWFVYSSAMTVFRIARTTAKLAMIANRAVVAQRSAVEAAARNAPAQAHAAAAAAAQRSAADNLRAAQQEAAARAAARMEKAAMNPTAGTAATRTPNWRPPSEPQNQGGWTLRATPTGRFRDDVADDLQRLLQSDKVPFRIEANGSLTITVGDRDAAEALAGKLNTAFGRHLAAPDDLTTMTHRQFAGNVWAQFAPTGPAAELPEEMRIFDITQQRHGVPAITRFADAGDHTLDAYRQADRILVDAYGSYYTGTGAIADKHNAHLVQLAAQEANTPAVSLRTPVADLDTPIPNDTKTYFARVLSPGDQGGPTTSYHWVEGQSAWPTKDAAVAAFDAHYDLPLHNHLTTEGLRSRLVQTSAGWSLPIGDGVMAGVEVRPGQTVRDVITDLQSADGIGRPDRVELWTGVAAPDAKLTAGHILDGELFVPSERVHVASLGPDASRDAASPVAAATTPAAAAPQAAPLDRLSNRSLDVNAIQIPDHIVPTERDALGRDLTPESIRRVVAADPEVQADRRRLLAEIREVYRDPDGAARRLTGLVERAGMEEAARGLRADPTTLGALLRDAPPADAKTPVRAAYQRLQTQARNIADSLVRAGGREHKVANRYVAAVRHRIDIDKKPLPELSKEAASLVAHIEKAKTQRERVALFTVAADTTKRELTAYVAAVGKHVGKDTPEALLKATAAAAEAGLLPASVVPVLGQVLRVAKIIGEVALIASRAISSSMEH